MGAVIKAVFAAPLATLFIVAGMLFLLIGVVGNISGKIEPGEKARALHPATAELRAFAALQRDELLEALTRRSPSERCWSWSELGDDIAWVTRRQGHEALIHRVDAELAAGVAVGTCDATLAADGVDELVRGFLVGVPAWATWTPEGTTVALDCTDVGHRFVLELGRMTGTSPNSGRNYDLDAAELLDDRAAPADVEITGGAWDLDRWLWGRGELAGLTISGQRPVLERFRQLIIESTQ
jgi:hypothetical protein